MIILRTHIRPNAHRNTVQRQIILDTLRNTPVHPTVDELYAEIRKSHPNISKTTVYRNLHQLADSGLIRQLSLPESLERYDGRGDVHCHFTCRVCGRIYDVDIDYCETVDAVIHSKYDFTVEERDVVFRGICRDCGGAAE